MGGVPYGRCPLWEVSPMGGVPHGRCPPWEVSPMGGVPYGRCPSVKVGLTEKTEIYRANNDESFTTSSYSF